MSSLFFTILPLLFLVLIGYVAGKTYKLSVSQYGYLVAFVLAPMVSFGAILQLDLKLEYLYLPLFLAIICLIMTILSFKLGKLYLKGTLPNLAGMACSAGNTGFFGLPIYLFYAPIDMTGIYLLANVGMQIIESSVGYYIGSRGHLGIKESLIKLAKMPQLWSVFLALIMNLVGLQLPDIAIIYWKKILDAWIILGMIMIGVGLAGCVELKTDILFCTHMMLMRFVFWPLITLIVVLLDFYYFHLLNNKTYFILAVISLVPLPGNSVALSATLGLHPDKMAFAVVLSTILATLIVPFLIFDIYTLLN